MYLTKKLTVVPILSVFVALSSCSKKEEEPEKKSTAITIEVVAAEKGDIQTWTFGEGTARATRREYLNFENAGRVTYIKEGLREGSEVEAGDILVRQDQRQMTADVESSKASVDEAKTRTSVAQAELDQALTEQKLAQTTFERFKILLKKESASQQEFDEAKAKATNAASAVAKAKSQVKSAASQVAAAESKMKQSDVSLESTELRAPISGVVARMNVVEGFYVSPSLLRTDSEESLLQTIPVLIIDRSSLEITVDIPPMLNALVKPKQVVYMQPNGGSDEVGDSFDPTALPVRGEVYSVTPSLSPDKRTIQVKIRTEDGDKMLQDGTFVTAWIATQSSKDTLIAPQDSIIYRENKPHLFIADPESNTVRLQEVELGLSGIKGQEITSGIKAGDLLVTKGRYQLSEGSLISILKTPVK